MKKNREDGSSPKKKGNKENQKRKTLREFSGSHFRAVKTHSSFLNFGKFQSGYVVSQRRHIDRLKIKVSSLA